MSVKLEIPLTFSEFGWLALEERARSEGFELERLLALACSHYAAELAGGRAATIVPRLGQPPVERDTRGTRTLALELGAKCLRRLEQEAERQGVALERLCEHAGLLYLADLDADRAGRGIIPRADPSARGRGNLTSLLREAWASVPRPRAPRPRSPAPLPAPGARP